MNATISLIGVELRTEESRRRLQNVVRPALQFPARFLDRVLIARETGRVPRRSQPGNPSRSVS
jgi:hypothetical protein